MSDARDRLIELMSRTAHSHHVSIEKTADAILEAGWQPPNEPKVDIVEEEARRLWGAFSGNNRWDDVSRQNLWCNLARHVLRERCAAKLAGVRERCEMANRDSKQPKCGGLTCCRYPGGADPCQHLQERILAEFGYTPETWKEST